MFGVVLHNCFQVIGVCPFQFCGWLNPPARREFRFGFVYVFLGCLKWLKLIGSYIQRRARLVVFVLICLAKQFSRQKAHATINMLMKRKCCAHQVEVVTVFSRDFSPQVYFRLQTVVELQSSEEPKRDGSQG